MMMNVRKIVIIVGLIALQLRAVYSELNDEATEIEMVDVLAAETVDMQRTERSSRASATPPPSLRNAASRFLLEIYDELSADTNAADVMQRRRKRATSEQPSSDVNFITPSDRIAIDRCNNIIAFASESTNPPQSSEVNADTLLRFNTTAVPPQLRLVYAALRVNQDEAYICDGVCNFPLSSHMNATAHAIVQTLMQLQQPHLPQPCCVPTGALGAISILHYLNDDSVNLSKYPQSVVKACGCQ